MAHWIAPNERSIIPRNYVTLDTEAKRVIENRRERQTFRCATIAWDRQSQRTKSWMPTEWQDFTSPTAMWDFIDGCVRTDERMVIVSHNAGYDIRISDALAQLARLGWSLEILTLGAKQTWAAWRREKQRIVWVDSLSWLPHALHKIGDAVGVAKRPLPDDSDDISVWFKRCQDDVAILRTAWMRVTQWLMDTNHGNWRPTGAGQCWQTYRHRYITHRILVHDDVDARIAERRAAWTGRAEAWQHGKLNRGPYTEFDMSAAYARIAQNHNVPTRLVGESHGGFVDAIERNNDKIALLSECTVTTNAPCVPTLHEGKIIWPSGTFQTTLWDNEARLVLQCGGKIVVHRQWVYRSHPALKAWADWILSMVDARKGSIDPVIRMVAKHWSRALIGRFGSRYSQWEYFGEAPTNDIALGWSRIEEDGPARRTLHVGDRVLMQSDVIEGRDAAPQVMSWIMAQCRVDLWHLMHHVGFHNVIYVDTDSVIVGPDALPRMEHLRGRHLVRKAKWRQIEILGTRRIILDGDLRAAGVATGAVRTGERSWQAEQFGGMIGSLSTGDAAGVTVTDRTVRLKAKDVRRHHLPDGATAPYVLGSQG